MSEPGVGGEPAAADPHAVEPAPADPAPAVLVALQLAAARERLLETLRLSIDQRGAALVPAFVRRILALEDRGIRAHATAERLRRVDAHLCLALLTGILARSEARDGRAQEVLLDLTTTRPLVEMLGYAPARRLYELAWRRGQHSVARMFLSPESLAGKAPPPNDKASENRALPDQSLGMRKAWARSSDRLRLDRLIFDRNPMVIRLLLANPRIVERDVVRIAAMRPTQPGALLAVFEHRKWISRYRVKTALAANPHTPLDVALALLPHLQAPDLQHLAGSRLLLHDVRRAARDLLVLRGQPVVAQDGRAHRIDEPMDDEAAPLDIDLAALAQELEGWQAPR